MSVVNDIETVETFICLVCNESLKDLDGLKNHLSFHTRSPDTNSLCIESSANTNLIEGHFAFELPQKEKCIDGGELALITQLDYFQSTKFKEIHVCSACGKEFKRKEHLNKHFLIHTGKRPFPCLICGKSFARKDRLKDHCVIHLANGWSCYFCGKMFSQRCILRKHEMIHRGIKPFICELCDKKFSRKNDLVRHHTSHTGEKKYFCEVCRKGFTQKRLLKRHLRIHEKEESKQDFSLNTAVSTTNIYPIEYFA